ncbi:MAG: hypothetical protein J3K34DRAFT_435698 [Monoraphidium minutum]|nr:MAG: hypothetical protein J3K34DRAFT_435698 [Monoraphidium minutum]
MKGVASDARDGKAGAAAAGARALAGRRGARPRGGLRLERGRLQRDARWARGVAVTPAARRHRGRGGPARRSNRRVRGLPSRLRAAAALPSLRVEPMSAAWSAEQLARHTRKHSRRQRRWPRARPRGRRRRPGGGTRARTCRGEHRQRGAWCGHARGNLALLTGGHDNDKTEGRRKP